MPTKTFQKLFRLLLTVLNSIGFRTAILALVFLLLSVGMVWLEQTLDLDTLTEKLQFWLIQNETNAFGLLNALLSSTISLTVFSFSMVMVVLNQAASSISPRVIPEIITRSIFQNTLGLYIGTIIYMLFLRLGLEKAGDTLRIPQFGIALAMLLLVVCLVQFIFFIHAVSRAIQVDSVVSHVYRRTLSHLKADIKEAPPEHLPEPDTHDWAILPVQQTGFYQGFRTQQLVRTARKHDLMIRIIATEGSYLVQGEPFLKVSRDVRGDEKTVDHLMRPFIAYGSSELRTDPNAGLERLMEIAIRALSPSLNDPMTAVQNIHHLSYLLIKMRDNPQTNQFTDRDGTLRIIRTDPTPEEMLRRYLGPILHYGKADVLAVTALLQAYRHLLFTDPAARAWRTPLVRHLRQTVASADEALDNPLHRAMINEEITRLNTLLDAPIAPI